MNTPIEPNAIILYVTDPSASIDFYRALLGREPVEASVNFAMFALNGGTMLGLWARRDVEPKPAAAPGSVEIVLTLAADDAVTACHTAWRDRGIVIAQPPSRMDFGFTFVALDPDGHRIRVFAPGVP